MTTSYYGKLIKRSHHINVLQNVTIYVFPKKFFIICHDPDTLLNKRRELTSKCQHKNKILFGQH